MLLYILHITVINIRQSVWVMLMMGHMGHGYDGSHGSWVTVMIGRMGHGYDGSHGSRL